MLFRDKTYMLHQSIPMADSDTPFSTMYLCNPAKHPSYNAFGKLSGQFWNLPIDDTLRMI